jgi:hypothetical protein
MKIEMKCRGEKIIGEMKWRKPRRRKWRNGWRKPNENQRENNNIKWRNNQWRKKMKK